MLLGLTLPALAARATLESPDAGDRIASHLGADRDYSRGVVALNTNRSVYSLHQTARLQIGVVDGRGHTVCDAEIELTITTPLGDRQRLSTSNGRITRNPKCGPDNVIDSPDYFADYEPASTGTYDLTLVARAADVSVTTQEHFDVREEPAFDVERIGPTRIYPVADYEMTLRLKATRAYRGSLREYVPHDFDIRDTRLNIKRSQSTELRPIDPRFGTHDASHGRTALTWRDLVLESGDELELTYTFNAPDTSPELYLLGRAELDGFVETRGWKVAVDAVAVYDTFTELSDLAITSHLPDTGTGWAEVFDDTSAGTNAEVSETTDIFHGTVMENGVGQAYTAQPAPSTTDQNVSITLDVLDTTSSPRTIGMFARRTDDSNFYHVELLPNAHASPSITLYKFEGGTPTPLGSFDATLAVGMVIKLEVRDATKKVFVDGIERISSSDNSLTAAGTWGLYLGNYNGAGIGGDIRGTWKITEFLAEDGALGPAAIYYSVGTDNTALYSDTASATAGTLTLNSPAADDIGVGDEVRQGANRYYITGRNSATEFTIQNSAANGGTPGDTNLTFGSTAITIFRAFNSLAAAVASSSDGNHLGTSDLVAGNYQLNWPCYGDGEDSTSVEIIGWTTGPSHYIKVYTPVSPAEVGTSQRHDGKWNTTSAYRIANTGGTDAVIEVSEQYVRIDGLQVDAKNVSGSLRGIFVDDDGSDSPAEIWISNNIVRMSYSATAVVNVRAITALDNFAGADNLFVARVWNNIVYGWVGTASTRLLELSNDGTLYAFNNTLIGDGETGTESIGIDASGGNLVYAKNNISIDSTLNYDAVQVGGSTNNFSDKLDAPGANPQNGNGSEPVFVNKAGDDYHLDATDTLAKSLGADLSGDSNLSFTVDIDGQSRAVPWEIGADELFAGAADLTQVHYQWRNDDGGENSGAGISETGSNTSIGTNSPASITHGLTINANDVIVAIIHLNTDGENISDDNGAFPFTEQFEEDNSGESSQYAIYYRVAGASEPASYSWDLGGNWDWSLQIRVFSGVDTASVWDVAPSASTRSSSGSGTNATAPTMTTSTDGAMGIIAFFSDSLETFSSPTNGYGAEVEPASSRAQASYIRTWPSAGATGTSSATLSASNDWLAHQFALKPAGGATFAAAQDTKLCSVPKGALQRLRFEVSNEGSASSGAVTYQLQAAETATCSAGIYAAVPTGTSGHWQIVDSGFITDGEATSNISPGLTDEATTFVAGELKDAGSTTGNITLDADEFTEIEFALQATTNATDGGDYCFRLYDTAGGSPLDTYSVYADACVAAASTLTLADHDVGQIADQFTTITPLVATELFGFKLSAIGTVTVDNIRVSFSTAGGVANGDVTNGALYCDENNDGLINGGDTPLATGVAAVGGVLNFTSLSESPGAGANYLVRADVANLIGGDTTTFSLGFADIDEVEIGVGELGAVSNAVHTQDITPGGDVYFSIGTDPADHMTGSPLMTLSSGTATFTVSQTGVIGVGDEVDYNAGTKAYIKSILSQTQFVLHTGTGAAPSDVTNATVNSITRAFGSVQGAIDFSDDAQHLTMSDLTATGADANLTWVVYNDGPLNVSSTTTITGYTTDASHYITLTVAGAYQVASGVSQRHTGVAGTGAVMELNAGGVTGLQVDQPFSHVEWLELDGNDNASTVGISADNSGDNAVFEKLVVHNVGGDGVQVANSNDATDIRNIIVYDYTSDGVHVGGSNTRIYNSTFHLGRTTPASNSIQTDTLATNTLVENVLAIGPETDFYENTGGTLTLNNCMTSDNTADDFFGSGNIVGVSAATQFVSTGGPIDLHLVGSSDAINAGLDRSGIFLDDIDGETRVSTWDIGADELAATRLFRSVGTNAAALESGAANAMTISGSTATFATGLADNVGVGDAIQYDSDGNSTIDAIAFIHARTDSQTYTVKDEDGAPPLAVAGDNDWELFRAYTRLANWESQTENTNINLTVRNFDTSTNLVSANTVMMAAAYADGADTTSVVVNGWTTGPTNYIKIFTPTSSHEVGTTQRHNGAWDTGAYRLQVGGASVLRIQDEYVRVDGLQLWATLDSASVEALGFTGAGPVSYYEVSNNIVRGTGVGTTDVRLGINLWSCGSGVMKAWNNIVYDFAGGTSNVDGIAPDDPEFTFYLYNNTVTDSRRGIMNYGGTVIAKNNLSYMNADNWNGIFSGTSTNNLSGPGADAQMPASGARNGVPVTFVSYAGDDFHLAPADTGAQDFGADLTSDSNLAFARDIDGGTRMIPWDIGADDALAATAVELIDFTARAGDGAAELLWETGSELSNLGFHVYRSLTAEGPYERLTSRLIPGLGSSPQGAHYAYRDSGLTNGVTYYYNLEDVETTGKTELHGPVSVTPQVGAAEVLIAPDESEGVEHASSRITYGKPWENEIRLQKSGRNRLVVELITEGFYAYPQEDGSVRLEVPGLDLVANPGEPAVPVYRGWVDAIAGRKVALGPPRARNVDVLTSLRPSFAEAPIAIGYSDGTVRAGARKAKRAFLRDTELYPESPAQLVEIAFQGEVKKALVELAPLRWDENEGRLLLARRLEVLVSFKGREPSERLLANGKGRRHLESHNGINVLARFATEEAGLHAVRFEDVFGKRGRKQRTRTLRLSRQGEAVAFFVAPNARTFAKGSVLYFLSEGAAANPDGDEAVYELESSDDGVTMEKIRSDPKGAPVSRYWKTLSLEENRLYQASFVDAEDVWQWDWLYGPMAKSFPFQIDDLAASAESSRLDVWLQGATDFPESPDHHARLYVNTMLVAEDWWDGESGRHLTAELGAGVLHEGENVLEVEEVGDTDAAYSMILLDRFDVTYPAPLSIHAGQLQGGFDQSGAAWISGLDQGYVLDVTGAQPQWLSRVNRAKRVGFGAVEGHRYLIVSPEGLASPEIRVPVQTSLRNQDNAAEYVVIGPREFLGAAEPLVELRESEGLRSQAVAIEDIYSEFGHGEATPDSVREFLSYAYHHWSEPSLRYVLLLGDATYDPKDYLGTGVSNQVPVKLVKTRYLWTASDPWLAAINGEDILPDIAIGRLPAASLEELTTLVDKILAYESEPADPNAPIVLIADNPDAAGNFEANAETLASGVLSGRFVDKIYLSREGTSAARGAIVNAFDDGASVMSYIGHGAIYLWANENLFNVGNVESLSPQSQQPVLFTMNCLNGYFHFPYNDSLSEKLLKADGKGVIAAFSPTGLSLDAPAHRLHEALLDEVVNRDHARLGDAILAGQTAYAATGAFPELLSIYHLLGDPALRLR